MKFFRNVYKYFINTFQAKPEGPVRYMFPFAAAFAVLLGATAITSLESSYASVFTSKSTLESGDRLVLDVLAYAHIPVNAIDVTVNFDADAFEIAEIDRGNSVITIWTVEPIVTDNSVTFRGGTFRNGFLGEHTIASIEFVAKDVGRTEFTTSDIVFVAGDGAGTLVPTTDAPTSDASVFVFDNTVDADVLAAELETAFSTDLNKDDKISIADISIFMSAWASRTRLYDFNGDNRMTFTDFSIILAQSIVK